MGRCWRLHDLRAARLGEAEVPGTGRAAALSPHGGAQPDQGAAPRLGMLPAPRLPLHPAGSTVQDEGRGEDYVLHRQGKTDNFYLTNSACWNTPYGFVLVHPSMVPA